MLVNWAISILRRSGRSVIINCKFNTPVDANVANNLDIYDNEFPEGTQLRQGNFRIVNSDEIKDRF